MCLDSLPTPSRTYQQVEGDRGLSPAPLDSLSRGGPSPHPLTARSGVRAPGRALSHTGSPPMCDLLESSCPFRYDLPIHTASDLPRGAP
jgi:hypothetical protein